LWKEAQKSHHSTLNALPEKPPSQQMANPDNDILFQSKPNLFTLLLALAGMGIPFAFFYQTHPALTLAQQPRDLILYLGIASIFAAMGLGSIWMVWYVLGRITISKDFLIISYPLGLANKTVPLREVTEITSRRLKTNYYASNEGVVVYKEGGREARVRISSSQFRGDFPEALRIISRLSGVAIVDGNRQQLGEEAGVPTNGAFKIIGRFLEGKSIGHLLTGMGLFLLWLLLTGLTDAGTVDDNDLMKVTSTLESPPQFEEKPDKTLYLKLDGYSNTFIIRGFSMKALCDKDFMAQAAEGMAVSVSILKSESDGLSREVKSGYTLDVYRVELQGQAYGTTDLYNALQKANRQILHIALIASILCLIYTFISKPKIRIWVPMLLIFLFFFGRLFYTEMTAYRLYKRCQEVHAPHSGNGSPPSTTAHRLIFPANPICMKYTHSR
jgi:hypothetical protein